jgi:hypothetical protein
MSLLKEDIKWLLGELPELKIYYEDLLDVSEDDSDTKRIKDTINMIPKIKAKLKRML